MTYEYECRKCGQRFDKQQRVTEEALKVCECGEEGPVARVISGGLGVLLPVKGSVPAAARPSGHGGSCCGGSCGCRH